MSKPRPIRVFYSLLTGRFYATRHYRIDGENVVCTGEKFDVTNDIGNIITTYAIEFSAVEATTHPQETGDV